MPRRLKLSPMQREIMVTLAEAGGETLSTVIATVKPSDHAAFDQDLVELIKLGLIRKERSTIDEDEVELVLTETGVEALHK
jgi:DNA-binding MarR family transcriptional regulator